MLLSELVRPQLGQAKSSLDYRHTKWKSFAVKPTGERVAIWRNALDERALERC